LNPGESDETLAAACLNFANDPVRLYSVIGLVKGGDDYIYSLAQNPRRLALKGNTVQHGHRVGRDVRTQPLHDVTVVVIMGWFDEIEPEYVPRYAGVVYGHGIVSSFDSR
jgi:hypothetical protein